MNDNAFLLLIKPEGIHRLVLGKVINFIEENGLKIMGIKMLILSKKQAEGIYNNIIDEPFYEELIHFLTNEPCVAIAIDSRLTTSSYLSRLVGRIGEWGTVRGLFSNKHIHNMMHCSDSDLKSKEEANLIFSKEEQIEYTHACENYL